MHCLGFYAEVILSTMPYSPSLLRRVHTPMLHGLCFPSLNASHQDRIRTRQMSSAMIQVHDFNSNLVRFIWFALRLSLHLEPACSTSQQKFKPSIPNCAKLKFETMHQSPYIWSHQALSPEA